jgi:hypothetical protein
MKIGILCLDVFRFPKDYNFLFFQFKNSYFGFKYIINQIDKKHTVENILKIEDINEYDYVLCSFVSFEDYYLFLKLMKNIKKTEKTKIIAGGAGILNVIPIYDYIDIAVFGRCDNQINGILNGDNFDNVWHKELDSDLSRKYKIGQLSEYINIDPDLRLSGLKEDAIGCRSRCFFCNYSFKYEFQEKYKIDNYHSGYSTRETTFKNLKWRDDSHYLVCALDAMDENKRYLVNKIISNQDIKNKILERDNFNNEKSIQVKLYNIHGYPFEQKHDNYYSEFDKIMKECDEKINHKITFLLHGTHFVPMPLTPMENEPINLNDFKHIQYSFSGKNIKVIKTYTSSGVNASIRHSIINMLDFDLKDLFIKYCTNYNKLFDYMKKYYDEQKDDPIPYICRNINNWKKIYSNRKNNYLRYSIV